MRKTDTEKFANLIMMYQDDMYYLALSICKNEADAQDIVGETIVKAFEAGNQLRNDARFKYWIMKILTNTAYTYLKRKTQRQVFPCLWAFPSTSFSLSNLRVFIFLNPSTYNQNPHSGLPI